MKYTDKKEIVTQYNRKLGQLNSRYKKQLYLFDRGENVRKIAKSKNKTQSYKEEAYKRFQKRCRLKNADADGYVTLLCSGKRVKYTECDGGHLRPKKNFPAISFDEDNCRPISKRANKLQGDQFGHERYKNVIDLIGEYRYRKLEEMSKKKVLYKKEQYEYVTEKYKSMCERKMQELGL